MKPKLDKTESFLDNFPITDLNKIVMIGLRFPIDLMLELMTSTKEKDRLIAKSFKQPVLEYIKKHKDVFTSQIMDEFNLNINQVRLILKELAKEGKIKINR